MSVLTATKSTWLIPESIIRSTAFRPAPPTPTTRMTARYDALSRARSRRAGWSGSGSSQRARRAADRSDSGSGPGPGSGSRSGGAGATARIGVGGSGARSSARVTGGSGSCSGSVGSCCCSPAAGVPWRCAASVARNSSARGPSRMLARFLAIEHLLREVAVHVRGGAGRFVREDRRSLHRRLGEANGLADTGLVDEVAEVLAQDLVRFARVGDALVEHRRDDADDRDPRVQVLAHHRERVLELDEAAEREVLRLHGHEHAGRSD